MGTVDLSKSPRTFSPQNQEPAAEALPTPEDLQQAAARMLEAETANVLHYLGGRLSGETLERLDIKGYISRHYKEMYSRYAQYDDHDDAGGARRSATEIAHMLHTIGDAGTFNTGEIETSGKKGRTSDLEKHTNSILRGNTETGTFLNASAAGLIVKCVFRDNEIRPGSVTDVKLAVNIPDSDLIKPIFRHYAVIRYLIKDLICRHAIESIEREIDSSEDRQLEERIAKLLAEHAPAGFNLSNVRGSLKHNADIETIRADGFALAVSVLATLLEKARLGYQFFEVLPGGGELIIREYENGETADLPDERFNIRLKYFDQEQLLEEGKVYDAQVKDFEHKLRYLWDLIEVTYQDSKNVFKVNDFEDLAKKNKGRIRDLIKKKSGEPMYEITGEYALFKGNVRAQLARMHERIKNMYEFLYPVERRIMEDYLAALETESSRLDFLVNPRFLQPGLLIDIGITSIKQRKTTVNAMANVLNEFLHSVFRGFQAAALAATINCRKGTAE